jgi:LysM repeat protein
MFIVEEYMFTKRFIQVCLIVVLCLTSLAATNDVHAWSVCGSSYVVQPGDWLAHIARYCGVTLADLQAVNPWTYSSYYIYPGQVLTIPGGYVDPGTGGPTGTCGPAWDAYGAYWIVCRGDTLGRIARYYGMSWRTLQWDNDIANPNLIYVGQILRP